MLASIDDKYEEGAISSCIEMVFKLVVYFMLLLMMAASLASLLISVQETLYAVKVVSIDSLLTTPFSNCLIKWCMAYNSQDAAIFQCLTARSMFPELPSIGADAAGRDWPRRKFPPRTRFL
jgi:hypothetical protein